MNCNICIHPKLISIINKLPKKLNERNTKTSNYLKQLFLTNYTLALDASECDL